MDNKNIIASGIDLSKFCSNSRDPFYEKPYNNEKFVYATNGYILIRLSRLLMPDFNNPITDKCPDYEKVIDKKAEFKPVLLSEITKAIDSLIPTYIDEYEKEECSECNGLGYIDCTECGAEKCCEECAGKGEIETDKIIGKIMIKKDIPFFYVHIDYKYLTLVKEVLEVYPSNWLISIKERLDPVQFKTDTDNIVIVVQPMEVR